MPPVLPYAINDMMPERPVTAHITFLNYYLVEISSFFMQRCFINNHIIFQFLIIIHGRTWFYIHLRPAHIISL